MSRIQALAPRFCPRCEARNSLFLDDGRRLRCRFCNYFEAESSLDETVAEHQPPDQADKPLSEKFKVSYSLIHPSKVAVWTRAAYDTGLDLVQRDDHEGAISAFRRALDTEPNFLDAHLWLGRLLTDPEEKREHYSVIAANMPNHFESIRELMVLNGEANVANAMPGREVPTQEIGVPVAITRDMVLQCPVCGGSIHARANEARCDFCGHVAVLPDNDQGGFDHLSMALIRERARPVKWIVGERTLHCNNCGADRTINERVLTSRCPFCSSNQVIEKDALDSFRQPDGIVPFRISQEAAETALRSSLNGRIERFKSMFINNRVSGIQLDAVFLPYWTFDASVTISRTLEEKQDENQRNAWSAPRPPRKDVFDDSVFDVPIPGVSSLPGDLINHLKDYNISQVVAYDPRHLARYSAELYTVDFEQASLRARTRISSLMRSKHGGYDIISDRRVSHVQAMITQMSFRLLLLPVWIAMIVEEDGDLRRALLNGQTGRVVLGRSQRPG